eukprot:gnl/TRDRNA2_/TRDRNA2_199688_c0_seq1.p1 gnl/TRDRNA2_/TRDRNA2_199688_c0~~gnl/TRDRNA2_/TRDRNA2_199688_c0_seq1.p1  ORF type:complete len:317 (+),score=37.23 gnl/TRDRNA2_/TRDRNA2_199688_c0_seq1:65-1015(+)
MAMFAVVCVVLVASLKVQAIKSESEFKGLHPGRFDGKVCLITGATSGIGEHAAYHLAQEGCAVIVTGRREALGAKVVAKIDTFLTKSRLTPSALFVPLDVSQPSQVEAAIKKVNETYGRLDAVFANAGIDIATDFESTDPRAFGDVMSVNVNGVYYTIYYSQALLKQTGPAKAESKGSMVLCSSIYGLASRGDPGYSTSKHAMEGLKKAAVQELGFDNKIRVNNVNPSYTLTEMVDESKVKPGKWQWILEMQMGGRFALLSEVSSVVAWLLSDDSEYVSGTSIPVDGGTLTGYGSVSRRMSLTSNDNADIDEKNEL